jgi:signal transduction histidine kinase
MREKEEVSPMSAPSPLPPAAQPASSNYDWMLETAAYLALAGGFLFAILTASHLTILGFLLLTAGNLAWAYVFRRMEYVEDVAPCDSPPRAIGLWVTAMVAITLLCLQVARIGMGLDWLLPLVTIGVFGVQLRPRIALGFSVAIWLVVSFTLLILCGGWTPNFSQNELTLFPAAVFTVAFSFVVRQQYTQRRRAEALVEQLEEAQHQLRRYASEVEELTVTRERNSMAREIHDTLGHFLTILAIKLETAAKLDERGDVRLHAELVEARRVAAECMVEVRRSVAALRPAPLSLIQLREILARLVAEFEDSSPGTQVTLDVEGPTEALGAELRLALFRSAQESLTNIRKHADASKVLVRLRIEGSRVELLVRDNGRGGELANQEPSFGLQGMRERIALFGGRVDAGPDPEQGWRVEVALPLPREVAAARQDMAGSSTAPEALEPGTASYRSAVEETTARHGVEA